MPELHVNKSLGDKLTASISNNDFAMCFDILT